MGKEADSRTITMSHGSGGKDSAELMEEVFGKNFSNEILDRMEDGAVLDINEWHGTNECSDRNPDEVLSTELPKIVTSTDSFVVTPLEFKGGDIGKLSICGTVNDILMMGGIPKYLTCGFIIEEGLEISVLKRIVKSMATAAKEAGTVVVAGDTKVIDRVGDRSGLFINTTGIGILPEGREISAANCKAGDAIIVSGNLGDHHACILSARMDIQNEIKSDCAVLKDIPQALDDADINVHTMRDVTRGGLGTVLNEIADSSEVSIEILEEKIPVDAEVKGFCGIMGLDPLYMGNEGKMIISVAGEDAEKALEAVRRTSVGKDAQLIGRAKVGKGVFSKTKIGGTRKIDLLYGEGLPRIC